MRNILLSNGFPLDTMKELEEVNQVVVGADNTDNKTNIGLVSTKDRGVLILFHSTNTIYTRVECRPGSLNNGEPTVINNGRTPALVNPGEDNNESDKHNSKNNKRLHTAFEFRIKSNKYYKN